MRGQISLLICTSNTPNVISLLIFVFVYINTLEQLFGIEVCDYLVIILSFSAGLKFYQVINILGMSSDTGTSSHPTRMKITWYMPLTYIMLRHPLCEIKGLRSLNSPLTLLKLSTVLSVLCTRSLRAACIDLKFKIIFYCEKRKTAKFPTAAHQWVSYS